MPSFVFYVWETWLAVIRKVVLYNMFLKEEQILYKRMTSQGNFHILVCYTFNMSTLAESVLSILEELITPNIPCTNISVKGEVHCEIMSESYLE